jgi:hypothetical protein
MLLLNRSGSPGLMVRPRPGRLELCGEFTHGSRLRGALAFVLGSAIAAERSVTGEPGPDQPPSVRLELEPAYERYGWYVDRRAAGADLHASGRTTVLRLEAGGSIDAQSHLELAAEAARACLVDLADADDLEPLQQMVAGDLSLPSEGPAGPERGDEGAADDGPGTTLLDPDPFGALLAPRRRVAFELAPVMVSWATCAFVFTDPARTARGFACVPRRHLSRFLVLLDAGGLDSLLGRYLAVAGDGTPLATAGQAREPGLFGSLGRRLALLPPEPGAADPSSVADASRPGRRDDSAHEAGAGRPQ